VAPPDPAATPRPASEPRNATIAYPGGLRARWRWGGSGSGPAVFALSEAGGALIDLGPRVATDPEALCRAELRLEGPRGAWTARFASLIHDDPRALHWDTVGLLVVAYGFHTYGLDVASGDPRWDHRSATPIIALLGSPRLAHVIVQAELETFAIEPDGTVAWRVAHSDVVIAADLLGGRLVLSSFDGQVTALDPATGRAAG
jgi:PQQ-like domain